MRIRTIKPDFWKHHGMSQLPADTRLLAIGLLNFADDEGYFNAHPSLIRGELMPFEEKTKHIPLMLEALERIGYITLTTGADGMPLGKVVNFIKHQRINRPTKSKHSRTTHAPLTESSMSPHGEVTEDSLWEGNREQGTGKGREWKGSADGATPTHTADPASISSTEIPAGKKEKGAAVPVSVEEALAYAASYSKGNAEMLVIEDASVRNWFDDRSACNWEAVRGGVQVPICDWRADLRKWAREDMRRNGHSRVMPAKKEKAPVVEQEPEGWWEAWSLCWPDVPVPGNWHAIPDSLKSDLRIKLEDMTR